jgi:hypothetical protein
MQHAPINDTARHRLEKVGMRNAPEVVREVAVHDFRIARRGKSPRIPYEIGLSFEPWFGDS